MLSSGSFYLQICLWFLFNEVLCPRLSHYIFFFFQASLESQGCTRSAQSFSGITPTLLTLPATRAPRCLQPRSLSHFYIQLPIGNLFADPQAPPPVGPVCSLHLAVLSPLLSSQLLPTQDGPGGSLLHPAEQAEASVQLLSEHPQPLFHGIIHILILRLFA